MTSWIKKIMVLALLVLYQNSNASQSITINGSNILLEDTENSVTFKVNPGQKHIALDIKDNTIDAGSLSGDSFDHISRAYTDLNSQRDNLAIMSSSRSLNFIARVSREHSGAYLAAGEEMNLSAGQKIVLHHTIAEVGSNVSLTSPVIYTKGFFLTTPGSFSLNAPADSTHWLKKIQMTPSTEFVRPFTYCLIGGVNFCPPSTDDILMVFGAESMTITYRK